MTKKARRPALALAGGILFLGAGCVTAPPPRELVDARAAYERVRTSPAAQASPALVRLAYEDLRRAEHAQARGFTTEAREHAYVAQRRLQSAEAEAAVAEAAARRERALHALATIERRDAEEARRTAAEAERRAAEEQERAAEAERRLAEEQARAATARTQAEAEQQRARQAEERLEQERQAREDAEARAEQAVEDLARVGEVRQTEHDVVITLSGDAIFAPGEASLLPTGAATLDSVAAAVREVPTRAVRVVIDGLAGVTAPGGDPALAARRAAALRDYLVARGLSPDEVAVVGAPAAAAPPTRVEIVVPGPAPSTR